MKTNGRAELKDMGTPTIIPMKKLNRKSQHCRHFVGIAILKQKESRIIFWFAFLNFGVLHVERCHFAF